MSDSTSDSSLSSSSSSFVPPSPSLSIRYGPITKDNWQQLKRLNLSILPVTYSDRLYQTLYQPENAHLTKFAYHNDILVGAIASKRKFYYIHTNIQSVHHNHDESFIIYLFDC
jgi:hypothetical protein